MGEVTGPISTLPGAIHELPQGTTCEFHPDRPVVVRIQGETDSFGSELNDFCEECAQKDLVWRREARSGRCDWCKHDATDLADRRDYEEGLYGPVYQVCGDCRKRRDKEDELELMRLKSEW